jgi:hypothetical protein
LRGKFNLHKLFYYGLAGFLLALTLITINSLLVKYEAAHEITIKGDTIKGEASNMKALINKPSITLTSKVFSLLIYVISLTAGLTAYLIVKHYYAKS